MIDMYNKVIVKPKGSSIQEYMGGKAHFIVMMRMVGVELIGLKGTT